VGAGSTIVHVGAGGEVTRTAASAAGQARALVEGKELLAITGRSPTDITAVGEDATIVHFGGLRWYVQPVRPADPGAILRTVWMGTRWTFVGGSPGRLYASEDGSWFYPGGPTQPADFGDITAMWGSSDDDLWVAGRSFAHLVNRVVAAQLPFPPDVFSVDALWGTSATDIWALANRSTVLHYDGQQWRVVARPTDQRLHALWGSSPQDLWVVGAGGTIVHHDGTSWAAVASGTTNDLTAIWGTEPRGVWAVGDGGVILRHLR
jgi:hypothetical protein